MRILKRLPPVDVTTAVIDVERKKLGSLLKLNSTEPEFIIYLREVCDMRDICFPAGKDRYELS